MDIQPLKSSRPQILLLSPSGHFGFTEHRMDFRSMSPSLGLLYLASELLDAGYLVDLIDFEIEDYTVEKIPEYILGKDVVGISVGTTGPGYTHVIAMIRDIRMIDPNIPIIVGGHGCIVYPIMIPGADVMVIGEAEHSIVRIVEAVLNEGNLSECEGVVYRDKADGTIKSGLPAVYIENLDTIKFPARHIVRKDRSSLASKLTTIITSRGCPFRCRFCGIGIHQGGYRERSVQNVLTELEAIVDQGYKYLSISDDNFLTNKKRVHGILDGIIERKIKLVIFVQSRVDTADEYLYRKMRAAGVRVIAFGLESGNQDTLDFYNKGVTVEENRYAVELADECGIYVHGAFILGAPMETPTHLERTIEFAKSLPLATVSFNALAYWPGSKLWSEALERDLIGESDIWVRASRERGLSNFEYGDITNKIHNATQEFYTRLSFWIWHLRKILTRRDREFIEMMTEPMIIFIRDNAKYLGWIPKLRVRK